MQTATAAPTLASFGQGGTGLVSVSRPLAQAASRGGESISCVSLICFVSLWTHALVLLPAHGHAAHFLLVPVAAALSTHAHVALRISHCRSPARCQSALIRDMICKENGD